MDLKGFGRGKLGVDERKNLQIDNEMKNDFKVQGANGIEIALGWFQTS